MLVPAHQAAKDFEAIAHDPAAPLDRADPLAPEPRARPLEAQDPDRVGERHAPHPRLYWMFPDALNGRARATSPFAPVS